MPKRHYACVHQKGGAQVGVYSWMIRVDCVGFSGYTGCQPFTEGKPLP